MDGRRGKKKKNDSLTAIQEMKRKFHFKCLFRAIGRRVLANTYWLKEELEHYEGLDVKKRVRQAVRGKTKKQLLSLTDKALLCKQAEDRTEVEKRYLFRLLGGLKCFKPYPTHVKRKLVALLYFKYYGPGRVIVREGQEAHAMYFIVSGEISVSHVVWDDVAQQDVSVEISKISAGEMFGEVSLLHNIPRTATCTTNGHCELLALMKEDFKNVLLDSVQKQWNEVQVAMDQFNYFSTFDEVSRREGCLVAKMKNFETNATILGDGNGLPNYVYFVLSGQCQMIESLEVIEKIHLGVTYYTLYDPYVPPEEKEDMDLDEKYFARYHFDEIKEEEEEEEEEEEAEIETEKRSTRLTIGKGSRINSTKSQMSRISFIKSQMSSASTTKRSSMSFRNSTLSRRSTYSKHYIDYRNPNEDIASNLEFRKSTIRERSFRKPRVTRTYFMQVCKFNKGGSFGFGENMRDRRIIALEPVYCMMLPKIWLLQKNTANIWTRIQHYLEKAIPKKAKLFKELVTLRKWNAYREEIVEELVAQSTAVNHTSIHDVPYSIRMEEVIDVAL